MKYSPSIMFRERESICLGFEKPKRASDNLIMNGHEEVGTSNPNAWGRGGGGSRED